MTISHAASTGVSTATGARGTTSTTVAYVGVSAGRMAILTVSVKPSTATLPATVTDGASKVWDKVIEGTGGTGTNAADTGTSRIAETGNVTITASNTPSQVCGAMDVYSSSVGGWLSPIGVTAADTTHGTNPTGASGTWSAALAAGDWVSAGYATDTDATNAASAHAISQTGTTFGTVTERSRVGNSDGNDGSVFTWDAPVNSGGATSATTMSMTWAANSCGAFAAVRLREATPTALTQTVVDQFTGTTIDTGAWDPWGGAQIAQNNQLNITSTTAAGYYGIGRLATIDIAAQYVGFRLVSAGNQAGVTSFTAYVISFLFSTDNEAFWAIGGGVVRFFTKVAGSQVVRVSFPYLTDTHRYFAVGFVSGTLHALWSKNGTDWVSEFSIANPFSGDTIGAPFAMVGTEAAEGSTTTLSVDDYSTWTAKIPVSQTFDVRWAIRNEATQSFDVRWAVRNTVTQSYDVRWAIRNTVSNAYDLRWAVRELATATKDIRWAIRNTVTATKDVRWAIRNIASQTFDVRWAVRQLATQSYDVRWSIQELITQTYDVRWAVRNTVQQIADIRWAIRNTVTQAYDVRWAMRQLATQSFDVRWAVQEIVTATFELLWDFQGLVSQTFDIRWAVRNTVTQTFEVQWAVEGGTTTVTQTYDVRWAIREQVTRTYDVRWAVRELVAQSFEARWAIRQLVNTTVDVRWAVREALVAVYDVRWSVRGYVLAVYTVLWAFEDAPSPSPVSADAVTYLDVFLVSNPVLETAQSPMEYAIVSRLAAS